MLLDSIQNAQSDIRVRALVEARTEAGSLVDTAERFIEKNAQYLNDEEVNLTRDAITQVRQVLDGDDKDLIQQKMEALNELTRPYAERVMDIAVGAAMRGKKI
jgi:molecular chaperone HscA